MTEAEIGRTCEDFSTSIQPYIDGELTGDEHASVASHVTNCSACRATAREQHQVRAALRDLAPERAPEALRHRLLAELDRVNRNERANAPSVLWWGRARAFFAGGLVMAPAAAVAALMFLGVRGYLHQPVESTDPLPPAPGPTAVAAAELAVPEEGPFEIQVPSAQSLPRDIELVGAFDADRRDPTRARVEYAGSGGLRFVDHQQHGGRIRPASSRRVFRGQVYYLSRDDKGRPSLQFLVDGVHHTLNLDGRLRNSGRELDFGEADFRALADLADAVGRRPASRRPAFRR